MAKVRSPLLTRATTTYEEGILDVTVDLHCLLGLQVLYDTSKLDLFFELTN